MTVTFTNTRPPTTAAAPRPSVNAHKRAAHSISSAPLARPPTSPRTPRAVTPAYTPSPLSRPPSRTASRKGFIGKREEETGARTRQLSLSIDLRQQLAEGGPKSAVVAPSNYGIPDVVVARATPEPPRLNTRSHTLPLASTHPHARKQSLLDGQLQLQGVPPSPSTSSSALDPIAELSPPLAKSFLSHPSIAESTSADHLAPPPRRPVQLGLGQPPSLSEKRVPTRTSFSTTFPQPNTELVLYSYAQLAGTVHIAPDPGVQSQELRALRATLKRSGAIGGGNMNILSPGPPARRRQHSRSASLSASASGLISSLLASSPSLSTSSSANGRFSHRSTGSASYPTLPSSGSLTAAAEIEDVDPTQPLPVLDVQPAMLAVDLSLLPGESRRYTYTLPLPANLPPTFRGRNLRFNYELVIGVCRAGGTPGAGGVSRVMKVPIRLYNNVSVGRVPRPYDLLWPVGRRIARDENGKVREEVGHALRRPSPKPPGEGEQGSVNELREYADGLSRGVTDSPELNLILGRPARWKSTDGIDTDEDGLEKVASCREAVEILTRTPKKASYDVNKDNVKVAVLTFTKSAYRLGETVLGVVEINSRESRSRVLQLSAFLESHETLPGSLVSSAPHRRLHAEHHSSFVLSTLRATFALDIPSDGSPAFEVGAQGGGYPLPPPPAGGLQWKVRLCLLVAVASEDADPGTEGVRLKSLVRDGPRGEWGASWGATEGIAPLVREPRRMPPPSHRAAPSWGYGLGTLAAYLGGAAGDEGANGAAGEEGNGVEGEYDGIKPDPAGGVGIGVDFGGKEDGWRGVRVETVECELPIKVWPGNTAFKALDVVFDV